MSGVFSKLSKTRPTAGSFGSPLRVITTVALVFLASQVIAGLILGFSLALSGRGAADLNNSIAAQFLYVLIAEGLAAVLTLNIVRRRRLGLASIGLGRLPRGSDIWRAGIGFVAFYGLLIIATVILTFIFPQLNTNQTQNLGFNNLSGGLDGTLAFVALVIVPPFGEEPLMRGYLFGGLRRRWGLAGAAVVTSALFGLAHLEFGSGTGLVWAAGVDTFVLSLVLCYLRETSGALYAGMLVHMLNNLVAFGVKFH